MKRIEWSLVACVVSLMALGCSGGGQSGPASAGEAVGPTTKAQNVTRCGPDGLIDDCEDNNNQVAQVAGRGGYWYTFLDEAGSTVEPAPGGTYPMSEGGVKGSSHSACMRGKIIENGSPLYAGLGFNWVDPKAEYDASKYGGIAFFAKKGPGTYGKIRIKIPDVNTDPQGGVCEQCFNDFGADIELTEAWTEYVVTWEDAKQLAYWGKPTPPKIEASKIYGFQIQVNKAGQQFDVCLDDVTFIGCGK